MKRNEKHGKTTKKQRHRQTPNKSNEKQSKATKYKENEELQTKVTLLSKELNVLRALFTNGGFTLPAEFQFSDSHSSVGSDRHSPPLMDSVSHRLDDSPRLPSHSHVQHSSAISIKQEAPKSAFHSMDESKIPPLRPMPRVANSPSNKSELHSPIRSSYDGVLQSSRESRESHYSPYKPSSHYSSSEKPTSSIVMMPHGQSSSSSSPYSSSLGSSHYSRSPPETQHTSVIRSSAELGSSNSCSSSNNLSSSQNNNKLGTFCIIQDPDNNGAVKIVPC